MVSELTMTFRKVILLSVLTVLLSVGLVYALSYEFKPQNSLQTLPTARAINDKFQLTVTLEKTEYSLGEPINITLAVVNVSNQTIDFPYSRGSFDFWVYNDTDNGIYRWSSFRAWPQILITLHLDPGEGFTRVLAWRQTCNETWFSEGAPVSPGIYYIVGQASHTFPLQTTPIQVTIVAP
jgi:hypothetical protein